MGDIEIQGLDKEILDINENDYTWHIWVMKHGKFNHIKRHIQDEVEEIIDLVYPQEKIEVIVKNKVKIKTKPLYANYLFVLVENKSFDKHVDKLNAYSFTTKYVGPASGADLEKIKNIVRIEERRSKNPTFFIGESVSLIGGPLQGLTGKIVGVKERSAVVEVSLFKRVILANMPMENMDLI